MKRVAVHVVIVLALALACAAAAHAITPAAGPSGPTVSTVEPAAAANDIEAAVTIAGSGFTVGDGGASLPVVTLGDARLTGVALVDATTLTATVPWGLDPGTYDLTVTNPGGGSATLPGAYTVKSGLGRWNAGDLFGGEIEQLLMKPGSPGTLYAAAYGIRGIFRSDDAGDHWSHVGREVTLGNGLFALDQLHPGRLYGYAWGGLQRSTDDGATWVSVTQNPWPGAPDLQFPQVFVSPYEDLPARPQPLFVGSYTAYGVPQLANGQLGLVRSTDGGATWTVVTSLAGVPVQDMAFDPSDHAHAVAATSDGEVWQSSDWGATWTQTTTGLPFSDLGMRGTLAFNPYRPGEVWISSKAAPASGGGMYKSKDPSLTSWTDVSVPGQGGYMVSFAGPDSVYCWGHHSTDGGLTWPAYGPEEPWYGDTGVTFAQPSAAHPADPLVAYIGDDAVGVRKTTDGGHSWTTRVDGLTGLRCSSLTVSQADPLRVFGVFSGPLGLYRSADGTSNWDFLPVPGAWNARQAVEDPADPGFAYFGADSGFSVSADGGKTWSAGVWNASVPASPGVLVTIAADPFQTGHVLASFGGGAYGIGPGTLYSSHDRGASWHAVTVAAGGVPWIRSVVFDPERDGTVYLAAGGVYRSTDHGATWTEVKARAGSTDFSTLTVATQPRRVLIAENGECYLYRSFDGGDTWERANDSDNRVGGSTTYLFAGADSRRLYAASYDGLWFSADIGSTWTRAAGTFGRVQILGIASGKTGDGRVVLYAATSGGPAVAAGAASGPAARTAAGPPPTAGDAARARAATAPTVAAGVYRYVVVTPRLKMSLSGLRKSALRLGARVTAKVVVTPATMAGDKVTLQAQRSTGRRWVKAASATRTIGSDGRAGWTYKPRRRGSYRVRALLPVTATHQATTGAWRAFRVK